MTAADAFLAAYRRPTIVADIDGTLGFLAETFTTALNGHFGTAYVVSEMRDYRMEDVLPPEQGAWLMALFDQPVTYANVAPDFTGVAAMQALTDFHLVVASDRSADCMAVTRDWLHKWRVPYDDIALGPTAKADLCAAATEDAPVVLFDDNPEKFSLAGKYVHVYAPQRPWTPETAPDGVTVFDKWGDVLTALGVNPDVPIPAFGRTPGPGMEAA